MRTIFMTVLAVVGFTTAAMAQTIGSVTITPIEHASVVLERGGVTVCVDPGDRGYWGTTCEVVLITHDHTDHFTVDAVRRLTTAQTLIVAPPEVYAGLAELRAQTFQVSGGSMSVHGLTIEVLPTTGFHEPGCCNQYVINFGSTRIHIAGDTDPTPAMMALSDIDVSFLPLCERYTMNEEEAAQVVAAMSPQYVIPYHWGDGRMLGCDGNPHNFASLVQQGTGGSTQVLIYDWEPRSQFVAAR